LIYLLYSLMLAAAMLLSLPYWLFQMMRHGKYRAGLGERLGRIPARLFSEATAPAPIQSAIWVHAVSVGEVLAVSGMVEQLRRNLPHQRVLISTTTDTAQQLARQRFGPENVFYFPMDFAFAIRPYLHALQPKLIILAETEFWPNFLRLAHASGARIAVVNARVSDRSWPNYRRFHWALRKMMAQVDLFLAQTEADKNRLESIGAPAERVQVTGNLKFDLGTSPSLPIVDLLRRSLEKNAAGPILVCGSTVEDEEPPLLKAFENVLVEHPHAVMILAPRHPERFDNVASLLQKLGIRFFRRSCWQGGSLAGAVLLLDSIGELAALYVLADIAFVGGSLVPRGGHNIIEPAQYGVAIIVGNYFENFRDIVRLFQSQNAVRVVTLAEFPLTVMQLLANDSERRLLGQRALQTMRAQMGATGRAVEALQTLVSSRNPESSPAQPRQIH
jgi:3-deoxy-D-manno-octulosonic-acid transferase